MICTECKTELLKNRIDCHVCKNIHWDKIDKIREEYKSSINHRVKDYKKRLDNPVK